MLRFAVFDTQGRPATGFSLRHAHAFGPDELPIQASITAGEGMIVVERPTPESTGLCVQIEAPAPDPEVLASAGLPLRNGGHPLGLLTLQTALLPQREEVYLLSLELARRQIMLFLNKLEEWGLFDRGEGDPVFKQFETARQMFTRALVAWRETDDRAPGRADRLALQALALSIDAGERLTIAEAEKSLPDRVSGRAYTEAVRHYTKITAETPSPGAAIALASATGVTLPGVPAIGVAVDPSSFTEPLLRAASLAADFITVPMRWSEMEPAEGKYAFAGTDRWIEWAVRNAKMPVVAGPLLDFRAGCVPDWLYIWENDYETLRELVVEHLQQVVTRYRRTVVRWTVAGGLHVNADIKLTPDQVIDLTRVAVAVVRKVHPGARLQLEVAQPWGEYHARSRKSLPPLVYADALIQVGLNIDALGIRLQMGQPEPGRSTRDLMTLSALLDRYAAFQRPLAVTALGVPSVPSEAAAIEEELFEPGAWRSAWSEQTQADWATQALTLAAAKPFVQSVCWQMLADAAPGAFTEMPGGGLCSATGTPKPALQRVIQVRQAIKEARVPGGIPGLGQF
ncbi:MAG: endo-1,4-beta-xylanase [Phycisphaeraceae bacterium]|nr:MAG: endo-1,4-beta-xylanase [Phycisphaeraceae bacterium]